MRSAPRTIASIAASIALVASSTLVAAAPAPEARSIEAVSPNAWMMLSTLSADQGEGLAGASAAAAQAGEVPPPPPPPLAAGGMGGGAGELIPFVLWFGLIALALTISGPSGRPNSPA